MNTESAARETPPTPLAIVGIGCLFPQAEGAGAYWANIKNGTDCITEVPATHWNPDEYFDADPKSPDMTYARRGGFLEPIPFNPLEFGIAPRDIEATDTSQLLGLVAAKMALRDAGIISGGRESASRPTSAQPVDRNRISVILGVTGTLELVIPLGARLGHPKWKQAMREAGIPEDAVQEAAARIAESYVPWQENSFPGLLGNVVAGRIANKLDLGGTNCVVDAACASSLSAVHLAALELATGRCDVAVTGGVDTFNDIFMFMCFSKTPALSPTGHSRPFDAAGDGTILGEGLGVVVLKRLTDAERDGDRIYAVIKGIGSSSDGKGNAIYAPSAAGQKKCLQNAYRLAGVSPDTIELVEAHGTGTKVGDAVEVSALTEVYGAIAAQKPRPWCAIGSVKSQIGHTKAAAGSASLIKAALALYNKVLPPTAKVTKPVEPLLAADSPFFVNTQARPWLPRAEHPRRAALSAFGFGGSNFHAVLEEYQPAKTAPDWDGSVEIWAASGATPTAILEQVESWKSDSWYAFSQQARAARSRFDVSAPCRLVLVVQKGATNLTAVLAEVKRKLAAPTGVSEWQVAESAFFGQGQSPGGLGILFPGQGSQYVGMLRDIATLFPECLDALSTANSIVAAVSPDQTDGRRLTDRIYPPTAFDPARKAEQEAQLKATENAQPALGAVSIGLYQVLRDRFGITPTALAGHSYGELPALTAAGRLTREELFRLSRLRGRLMAEQRTGDPGGMLAVFAPLTEIEQVVRSEQIAVVVANKNAPMQSVLSGSIAEIQRAEAALSARGVRSVRLSVAAAFHSPLVADAAMPFRAALEDVPFPPGTIPVFANTTAAQYPHDSRASRDLLGHQLANPVAFADEIAAMLRVGIRTFLEVGPASVLARLAEGTITESGFSDAVAFSVDSSSGKRPGLLDLAATLARLAARGHAVRLTAWEAENDSPAPAEAKPGLTVAVSGANVVHPRAKREPRPALSIASSTSYSSVVLAGNTDMPEPVRGPVPDPAALAPALQMTQETLTALQRMQEQTAQLHRQFLETQEQAQRTLFTLVTHQQGILFPGGLAGTGSVPAPVYPMSVPAVLPTPIPTSVAPTATPQPQPRTVPPAPAFVPTPVAPMPVPTLERPAPTTATVVPATPTTQESNPLPAVESRPAPTPPATPTVAASSDASIEQALLEVVSEKTGYPVGMLDLGMSLDADLGVDSIKRVEILSALQEKLPQAPQVKPEHLGTLHTLRDVAAFLTVPGAAVSTPGAAASAVVMANGAASVVDTGVTGGIDFNLPVPSLTDSLAFPLPRSEMTLAGGLAPAVAEQALLAVVAEKTGYPVEMLDLGMSLDADLGVDSIKRVEILSALQEKLPQAPQVKPEHLGTLHTLRDVAAFLAGAGQHPPSTAKLTAARPVMPTVPRTGAVEPETQKIPSSATIASAFPPETSASIYGVDLLESTPYKGTNPEIVLPIVANLDSIDRSTLQLVDIDANRNRPPLPLPTSGVVVVVGAGDALAERVASAINKRGLTAHLVPWVVPSTQQLPAEVAGLLMVTPARIPPNLALNRVAFQWLQSVGPLLRQSARKSGAAVLATVSRLDGSFGLGDLKPDTDPTAGGLAGLAKTARQEWLETSCKAIDIAPAFVENAPDGAVEAICDELLTIGPVEVGISASHRCTLELARSVGRSPDRPPVFGPQDIVLITGGARGVTAEVAVALAEASHATLILTGRTPAPTGPEPDWLRDQTQETGMKKAIADHLGAAATLQAVGEYYNRVMAQREIRATLARIEAAGSRVAYIPANISIGRQAADLLHQIQVKFGAISGLIHGAGVLADRRIEDLTVEQFDHVYTTKVDGLRHLLELLGHQQNLNGILLFSSTTGRLGRTGQLAYAVANEVLNKTAQVEARKRPNTRVVAINWGPWDGGMVTPALRKVFDAEGVGVIPLADGGRFAVAELVTGSNLVEIVALGKPPRGSTSGSGTPSRNVTHRTPVPGGIPVLGAPTIPPGSLPPNNLTIPPTGLSVAFERTVDIDAHPILRSHVLAGRAVLPMALHVEWLAHAALHGNPGLVFHGLNDLRIIYGVMVEEDYHPALTVLAGRAVKVDKFFHVPVELRGKRRDGREVTHSQAEIVLTAALPKPPEASPKPVVQPYPHPVEEVYRYFLFHGPELHGIEKVEGLTETAFVGSARTAPPPGEWLQNPLRGSWVADPLVLDTAFQMMILWSFAQHGSGSLPCYAGHYRQFRRAFPTHPVQVVIQVKRDLGSSARADIEFCDVDGQVIATLNDYECVIDRGLDQAFRRNQFAPKARV
ncbi:MAG: SDR family NAD(P)-dependent oxidoreductase [Bacteroidales bacterium]|nr:SDR family NAD(P)-dependent oxidoreductase [Bacteroidales bacterium]